MIASTLDYLRGVAGAEAWVWLDVALATLRADATLSIAASAGRMGAARYFYHYELPKIGAWLNVVNSRDTTCAALSEAAF